jgi:hypothetical protein
MPVQQKKAPSLRDRCKSGVCEKTKEFRGYKYVSLKAKRALEAILEARFF